MKRAIIIVMDSVGIGELPDASLYGDEGSNTIGNISANYEGFKLPNLEKLGLGNIDGIMGIDREESPIGSFGKMAEKSKGKDTTTGHWEMAGLIVDKPFPLYPNGFPDEIIHKFEKKIGIKTIGNIAASGTEIIKMLGDTHVRTGYPIVYTSADSVFQIAAHEDVVSLDELYEMCEIARGLLKGEHAVGRVIARPFVGTSGDFRRTDRRRDFSLKPIGKTILDYAVDKMMDVKTVGKIEDIFAGQGITGAFHTHNNMDGVDKTLDYMKDKFGGILFANLVDFDMLYGHRNDVEGYAKALMLFDERMPDLMNALKENDIMFITADHGCDPTTISTDHSREFVPILVYGKNLKQGVNLGVRSTFADLAATIAEFLKIETKLPGTSFYKELIQE